MLLCATLYIETTADYGDKAPTKKAQTKKDKTTKKARKDEPYKPIQRCKAFDAPPSKSQGCFCFAVSVASA